MDTSGSAVFDLVMWWAAESRISRARWALQLQLQHLDLPTTDEPFDSGHCC